MTDTPANPGPDFALDHVVLYASDPAVSSASYDALFLSDPDGTRFELTCYADPAADPVD